MKLHWSPRSPFVRKVLIVLHEAGLVDRVECVASPVSFLSEPNPAVLAVNPLGQIPTLVLDDGTSLYDSPVIAEYLDGLHDGPKLFPSDPARRVQQLRWLALADGLAGVLLLHRSERMRPAGPYDALLASLETKIRACFAALEKAAPALASTPFGIGQIAVVCALGQMDLRFAGCRWEAAHPRLAAWNAEMKRRPSVAATAVHDDSGLSPQESHSLSPFTFA